MTIYVFDLDGTLTPARLPMTKEFESFFLKWAKDKKCFIATGSDIKKVKEQASQKVLDVFEGVYCSMGNVLWKKGEIIYKNEFQATPRLIEKLEEFRSITTYPHELFGNYIEYREGMINFSVLGRDCPYAEREKYFAYDKKTHERERICHLLAEQFPEYDFSIGGMISIDITQKGKGKEQVAYHLRKIYPKLKIVFFGDKTFSGGNDYALAQAVLALGNAAVVQVASPDVVKDFLKSE